MSEETNYDIYVSGAGSHILRALFPDLGKVGQRTFPEVFTELLGIPFDPSRDIKELTPVDFLKLLVIRDLNSEDKIRRWIFLHQLLWVRDGIWMRYEPKDDNQIRIRWNRNKTLVSTANQLRLAGPGVPDRSVGREEEELVLDFGGGQLKSPYSVEDHDASELLEELNSGDSSRIHKSTIRVSALVGQLMGEAARAGHKGFIVRCLCTGKYWQEIVAEHSDKFANNTFQLEWIDSVQERALEFEGCEEAFEEHVPPGDPPSVYIGNLTSGGSSSEIWLVDKGTEPGEPDTVIEMSIPHGSKSDMFYHEGALCLPSRDEMMHLFQSYVIPPLMEDEDPDEDGPLTRTISGATW